MTLDHYDHLNPQFTWRMINKSNESVSVKSRAGMEYIVPTLRNNRDVDGGFIQVLLEYKNIYIDQIIFSSTASTTKLDKCLLEAMEERRQQMLKNPQLARNMPHTLCVEVVLKQMHVDEDDGIHSDLLGVSFFMDNDLSRKGSVGIAKGSTAAVNNKLMWEQDSSDDYPEEQKDRCVCNETRLTVLYNDPNNIFSGLWMNVLGQAKRLNKASIANVLPGLYITYRSGLSNNELVDRYYSFEELNSKVLDTLGIFTSKELAQKGGNTERYLEAESEIKSLESKLQYARKEITQLTDKNSNLLKDLSKEETAVIRLITENTFLKQESRLKDREQKIAMETIKGNSKPSVTATFVDICKGASLLTGAAVTAYKVFGTT